MASYIDMLKCSSRDSCNDKDSVALPIELSPSSVALIPRDEIEIEIGTRE